MVSFLQSSPEPSAFVQFGLAGLAKSKTIDLSEPAARLSNTGIQHLGEYFEVKAGQRKLADTLKPPTLEGLLGIYGGLQAHKALFFLNQYLPLEQGILLTQPLPPMSHALWQKSNERAVFETIFPRVVQETQGQSSVDRAIVRARKSLDLWLHEQNFYLNLPPVSQRTFHQSRLFAAGKREERWFGSKLKRQMEQLLTNLETMVSDSLSPGNPFFAADFLTEFPQQLYIRDPKGHSLLVWVQPDQVNVRGQQVIVFDHKFEKTLPARVSLDNFARLQILLLAVSGRLSASTYLGAHRRTRPVTDVKPVFLDLEMIPAFIEGVRVVYQNQLRLDTDGRCHQAEMTLTDNEIAGALVDLGYIIEYLADPFQRNDVYTFLKRKKLSQQGVTPETMPMGPVSYQPLLGL